MAKIESWKNGENKYSDKELWNARNVIESMEHPQTHQIINLLVECLVSFLLTFLFKLECFWLLLRLVLMVFLISRRSISFCGSGSTRHIMPFSTTATVIRLQSPIARIS